MKSSDTLTVAIVEDNPASLENLLACLTGNDTVQVVGTANNGTDGVSLIEGKHPDLVFLDVEMPGKNGFEVIEALSHQPRIIFVTAHDKFAVKAFEVNGVDYILKPVSQKRVDQALEKVRQSMGVNKADMLSIISSALHPKEFKKRFMVTVNHQVHIIHRDEVCGFKAQDKYVFLCTHDREYFYNSTLKDLIAKLDPDAFCKVNKSHIVALDKIKKLKKNFKLQTCLVVDDANNTTIPISKPYLHQLKNKLES